MIKKITFYLALIFCANTFAAIEQLSDAVLNNLAKWTTSEDNFQPVEFLQESICIDTILASKFKRKLVQNNIKILKKIFKPIHLKHGYTIGTSDCAALSPNNKFALTAACGDNNARLWDLTKFPLSYRELSGHETEINCLTFSGDGKFVLTGGGDSKLILWNLQAPEITSIELLAHESEIGSVAIDANAHFALSGSVDGTVFLWDLQQDPITFKLLGQYDHPISSVALKSDASFALVASSDFAYLWNLTLPRYKFRKLRGHTDLVCSVSFSADGKFAITGSCDNTARLWNLTTYPLNCKTLRGDKDWIMCASFSYDSKKVITGCSDNSYRIWNLTKYENKKFQSRAFQEHKDAVFSVALSNDDRYCFTAATTAQLRYVDFSCLSVEQIYFALWLQDLKTTNKSLETVLNNDKFKEILQDPLYKISIERHFNLTL